MKSLAYILALLLFIDSCVQAFQGDYAHATYQLALIIIFFQLELLDLT